ncbi:MAG TPA: hypothetical protein VGL91_09000 [Acidobacteriota bacterium]|jgi:hypothetical protein
MPARAPIPPEQLKRMLEVDNWRLVAEDEYNWVLDRADSKEPIIIPRKGELIALDVLMSIIGRVGWNNAIYDNLKQRCPAHLH